MFIDQKFLRRSELKAFGASQFGILFPSGCRVTEATLSKLVNSRVSLGDLFAYEVSEIVWLQIKSLEAELERLRQAKTNSRSILVTDKPVSRTHMTQDPEFELAKCQEEIVRLILAAVSS